MKLVSFVLSTENSRNIRIGALAYNSIVDLNFAYAKYLVETSATGRPYEVADGLIPPDMLEFLKGGKMANQTASVVIDFFSDYINKKIPIIGLRGENIAHATNEVKLLAPVPRPNSIRDTQSFEGHIASVMKKVGEKVPELWYKSPIYYKGNPDAVIGPDEPIIWPSYTEKLDYELEFGIFIGKMGKNIVTEEAHEYIAGYTIFNDVTARDTVHKEMSLLGPAKGKDFDNSNVMGPCLVTPDELDPANLKMIARINGELWSEGNTSSMYWSFPQIIEHISKSETLYPGDFIGSGTVGTGSGIELGRWIQPGDVIELDVEGIGIIRNQVLEAEDP